MDSSFIHNLLDAKGIPHLLRNERKRKNDIIHEQYDIVQPTGSDKWNFLFDPQSSGFEKLNPFRFLPWSEFQKREERKKCHSMSAHNSLVRFLSKIYDSTKLKIVYATFNTKRETILQFSMTTNKQTNKHKTNL
jgi:hypothetical protein